MATYLTPDKVETINGVTVKQFNLINHNPNKIGMPSKRTKKLLGITIHNTESINVNAATTMAEQYTRATYNGNMNTVRVHYFIDDKEAWQNLPLDYQGWHAADGSGNGNTATIAIECIGNSAKAEDNTARITAWLLYSNGLTVNDVYTHTYWLNVRDGRGANLSKDERCVYSHPYKVCPIYIIPHWKQFIAKVQEYLNGFRQPLIAEHLEEQKQPAAQATPSTAAAKKTYYNVVVGVYSQKENAQEFLKKVQKDYPDAFIKITTKSG